MTFLPFENFVIESSLNKEEIISALTMNIESEKTFRFMKRSDTKEFEGSLKGNEFEIRRIISYRNSFLPVINGEIESYGNNSRITIRMRLHIFTIIFISIWISIVGLIFIGLVAAGNFSTETLGAGAMGLFAYGLTMGGYLFESSRAKEILLEITKGRIVK